MLDKNQDYGMANFQDSPPESATLTEYDEAHLATYIRLLDAADEGADWQEAVQIIFGLDPPQQPARAKASGKLLWIGLCCGVERLVGLFR